MRVVSSAPPPRSPAPPSPLWLLCRLVSTSARPHFVPRLLPCCCAATPMWDVWSVQLILFFIFARVLCFFCTKQNNKSNSSTLTASMFTCLRSNNVIMDRGRLAFLFLSFFHTLSDSQLIYLKVLLLIIA